METFLQVISSFPTLPLTIGLGVAICYWLFALITGSAFEPGDGVADSVAGAVKGAGEAVTGAVKSVGEAVTGSVSDHAHESDLLSLLGVARVPITVTMSIAALLAWTISTLASIALGPSMLLTQTAVMLGAMFLGLFLSVLVVRPLAKAFEERPTRRRDVLGQVCEITSGRVDAEFGTAHVADGGAGLNLHVRCEKPNQLKKGDRAVVVDFDAQKNVYEIEPVDWLMPEEVQALDDPQRAAQILSSRIRHR